MKHQGKHLNSVTLAQVGPKFIDGSPLNEKDNNTSTINSNELLARQISDWRGKLCREEKIKEDRILGDGVKSLTLFRVAKCRTS